MIYFLSREEDITGTISTSMFKASTSCLWPSLGYRQNGKTEPMTCVQIAFYEDDRASQMAMLISRHHITGSAQRTSFENGSSALLEFVAMERLGLVAWIPAVFLRSIYRTGLLLIILKSRLIMFPRLCSFWYRHEKANVEETCLCTRLISSSLMRQCMSGVLK